MQRIVVTGPECTGKTTLARLLADALSTTWVPEFARTWAASHPEGLTASDVEPIARGQMAAEDAARRACRASVLVFDTDLVSTTVYAEFYYGSCPAWILAAARQRRADLYLLLANDLPWHADGVRDQPHARDDVHARFIRRLAEVQACVLPVSGIGALRFQRGLAAVRGWRAARAEVPHKR